MDALELKNMIVNFKAKKKSVDQKKNLNLLTIKEQLRRLFIDALDTNTINNGELDKFDALLSKLVEPKRKNNGEKKAQSLIANRDNNSDIKGRIFKFKLDTYPINNDMDNYLNNIVMNRDRQEIYLTHGKVANMSMDENDYIFIQSNGYLTHKMKCNKKGPIRINGQIEISVKDITTLNIPMKSADISSSFKGQGYSKLNDKDIKDILNQNL